MANRALASLGASASNIHCTYSIFGGDWNSPGNVIDGNDGTGANSTGANFCTPAIQIDLGAAYAIANIRAKQDGANTVGLAWSNDGATFTPLANHAPGSADETWSITPVSARYWRMTIPVGFNSTVYTLELQTADAGPRPAAYAVLVS